MTSVVPGVSGTVPENAATCAAWIDASRVGRDNSAAIVTHRPKASPLKTSAQPFRVWRAIALAAALLAPPCSAAWAQDAAPPSGKDEGGASGDANSANDPTSPKLTLEYWNYYAPSLYGAHGEAENGLGRILVPFKVGGVQQFLHIVPPVTGNPLAVRGPRTGLGDVQIYNFTLKKYDVGLPEPVTFGLGPLIAPPSNTSSNFGPSRWQAGVAGVAIAPQSWGLVGVLATYQHTLTGTSSQYTTVQPNLYYNLDDDYYFRSSAIMKFNTLNHTTLIPVGLGAGKVVKLDGGYTLNTYIEAQPTIYHVGRGTPAFQLFTGIELQFPSSITAGLDF